MGELAAIRTDAWRPIPADISTDDLWTALDLSERGYAIAYEPDAKVFEPPEHTLRQQWERRTRSVAGGLHVFKRRRAQLGPAGGLVAAEIWGHRLARYTVSPLAHVALLLVATRRARSSRLAKLFLLGHGIGVWSLAKRVASETASQSASPARVNAVDDRAPGSTPGATTAPDSVPFASGAVLARRIADALDQGVFLQAVALGGMVRYLRGDRPTRWTTVRR